METIVVPVDESLHPRSALRLAFSLANRIGCSVSLVTACAAEQAAEAERSLRAARARFEDVAPSSVDVLDGPPVDTVLGYASARQAMICLPTRGRAGLSRMVFGSVAENMIRTSTVPILCVGPAVTTIALPSERIEILICVDDSPAAEKVVERAARFAAVVQANCVVTQVHDVDEDIVVTGDRQPRPLRERALRQCSVLAERLAKQGLSATTKVLPGHPASSIVDEAERSAASFVAIGTLGRTGLDRLAIGSVATAVVRDAPCPVLVVPTSDRSASPHIALR